ncbi:MULTISPECIES: hypothetical protein [unclassified Salinivibrio]|uniref:hypothetical protein n=1 Tax=unclassified Salinivibrio TaxID=2636825 RepID=UPI0013019973|nr:MULTISPECIES: hypothetical protein [unclassified Salinivibrio]NUY57490.1 hypothetical protein [Salinivibrio sp. EAGSL]
MTISYHPTVPNQLLLLIDARHETQAPKMPVPLTTNGTIGVGRHKRLLDRTSLV